MSYANVVFLAPDMSSDAKFRTWGSSVSTQLSNMGLVQTSDTGQINWTTVVAPIATSTAAGYEIWRFADSLQATVPVYMKIEYGSGGSTARPSMWITVGSSTNGAGTISGQTGTRIQTAAATSGTANLACIFSGDTNRLGLSMFNDLTNCAFAIFVERTKNSDGTDSSLGTLVMVFVINSRTQQFIIATGSVQSTQTDSNIIPPLNSTGGCYGNDLAVYPNPLSRGGGFLNEGLTHVGYFTGDITAGSTFVITMYNATHTFMALGTTGFGTTSIGFGGLSNIALAMRYE